MQTQENFHPKQISLPIQQTYNFHLGGRGHLYGFDREVMHYTAG